jgi:hypothetical protein
MSDTFSRLRGQAQGIEAPHRDRIHGAGVMQIPRGLMDRRENPARVRLCRHRTSPLIFGDLIVPADPRIHRSTVLFAGHRAASLLNPGRGVSLFLK